MSNEKLAEALRAFPEDPNPFTYRRCYAQAQEALQAHAAEAAQAQAHCGEWSSIINEAADVLSDVTDMVGGATSKLPSSWRWSLIDELHGIAGQIAAAPQPQAAEPFGYAYVYPDGTRFDTGGREINGSRPTKTIPLYTHPQPAQDANEYRQIGWVHPVYFSGQPVSMDVSIVRLRKDQVEVFIRARDADAAMAQGETDD